MGACGSTVRSRQTEKPLRLPKSKDFKCEKTKKTLYRDLPPPGDSDQHDVPLIGVAKITVAGAKLQAKGNYNVTLSMGLQSFLSVTKPRTAEPKFEAERNFVIMKGGHVLHLLVHNLRSNYAVASLKRTPVGVAHVDLLELFPDFSITDVSDSKTIVLPLLKPNAPTNILGPGNASNADDIGSITITVERASLQQLESQFWNSLLNIADFDDSGTLDREEFERLMHAMMQSCDEVASKGEPKARQAKDEFVAKLWHEAEDLSNTEDPSISAATLSKVLMRHKDDGYRLTRCPISGGKLHPTDRIGNLVYMLFQMNSGMGKNLQGGFRTAAQANRSWIMSISEWIILEPASGNISSLWQGTKYKPGLNRHGNAAHIVVYNRYKQILEEEVISPLVLLAMRNMYQAPLGMVMKSTGLYRHLKDVSRASGVKMNDPASKTSIQKFVKAYRGQVDISEIAEDLDSFQNFNEFFYRKLKPGARPIASADDDTVLVSAADCRLMMYATVEESTQFWIKGRLFSVRGLLADEALGREYQDCSMMIFRLAPQDYHRFHSPVSGSIESIVEIPGHLYTVNPIAVNSPMCNVFTENKRVRVEIQTQHFGVVQFVAIGATAVGSINLTVTSGAQINKGDELGYFAFGGSTCITLMQQKLVDLEPDLSKMSRKSVETYVRMGDSIGWASTAATAGKSTAELPGRVMQQASAYSAAKVMDMRKLAQTMIGASRDDVENREPAGGAVHHWSQLRQATLRDKEFVSLLTDADDKEAQEALKAEALDGTVVVESESEDCAALDA